MDVSGWNRRLSDGTSIAPVGLGTAPLDDQTTEQVVASGIEAGYRLIDTGAAYGNEAGVGRGLRGSGVPRDEVAVMTKLRGSDHGYDETLKAFEQSRARLGLDRIDLYLIHWPLPAVNRYLDSWRAMISLRDAGLVRSIGVSNFLPQHLRRLQNETGVVPVVNQVEMHPDFDQAELRAVHAELGVQTLSYSPLGRGTDLLERPAIASIGAAHGVAPAQVVLRWHIQLGAVPLPRAAGAERRAKNLDVFAFELSEAEMETIGRAGQNRRIGFDPAEHEEF